MNRIDLVKHITELNPEKDSNLKFLVLAKSRLMEEGIPPNDAAEIVASLSFDFSNVNEEDYIISDIATEYAAYANKVYRKLVMHGLTNPKNYPKLFGTVFLRIED